MMIASATSQASACTHRRLTNGPIFCLLLVNFTSGTTANGSCRLRTTWLRISSS